MYLLKWVSRIFIPPSYFASIMIARAIKRIPIFKYQLCVSLSGIDDFLRPRTSKYWQSQKYRDAIKYKHRVFKPLSRNFYSSFFIYIYIYTRSFSISSLNNSINKNFKFSKVLFILPSKSLSLSLPSQKIL